MLCIVVSSASELPWFTLGVFYTLMNGRSSHLTNKNVRFRNRGASPLVYALGMLSFEERQEWYALYNKACGSVEKVEIITFEKEIDIE